MLKRSIFACPVSKDEEVEDVREKVMKLGTMDRRPLNFRDKPGFEITGNVKCPEAHLHGEKTEKAPLGTNLTIIYPGVFSNTFKLQQPKSFLVETDFKGYVEKVKMSMKIKFDKLGNFQGTGVTNEKKKKDLAIEGKILPSDESTKWKGFYVQFG